jgi:hypothetical protein
MSLDTRNNVITIRNPNGTVKFTSDNKLIYRLYSASGSVTVAGATVKLPFYEVTGNDFTLISFRITSTNGNVNNSDASLTGRFIPANGSVIIDVDGRADPETGTSALCDMEYIGANICGNTLVFNSLRFDHLGTMTKGIRTTVLNYNATVYSFL